MNRTVLFLFFILALIDVSGSAAAKRPNGAISPAKLPGIVDTKPPAFVVKASTAIKADVTPHLMSPVTNHAVVPQTMENKPAVAPALPKTALPANTTVQTETAAASTATITGPQTVPARARQKNETIPFASLKSVVLGDTTPYQTNAAPGLPVSAPTPTVSTVSADIPATLASFTEKTTQQVIIAETHVPVCEQTTAQIGSMLPAQETIAPVAVSESALKEEVAPAAVPPLTPQTTETQKSDISPGTTIEATATGEIAEEKKSAPADSVNAPVEGTVPVPQARVSGAPEEKPPQTREPVAPHEETIATHGLVTVPQKGVPPAGIAPVSLPPLPVSRPVLKKEEPKDTSRETLARVYRVVAGDTLPLLAERYYGDKSEWVRIYEANKDRIEKGSLQKGQILIIP